MLSTKASLIVFGVIVISGLGVGIYEALNEEPESFVLSMKGATTLTGEDYYVKDYKPYFVDHERNKNDLWWSWTHKHRWKTDKYSQEKNKQPGNNFSEISNWSTLKETCEKAYKVASGNVKLSQASGNDQYLERDVWRYCSIFGEKPKVISLVHTDDSKFPYEENSYGKIHKDELISVKYGENLYFWSLQEERFFGDDGIGAHKKTGDKTIFEDLYSKEKQKGEKFSVREACREAYKESINNTSGNINTNQTEVFNYCSLKGFKVV